MRNSRRRFLGIAGATAAGLTLPRPALAEPPPLGRVARVVDGSVWTGEGWTDADLDPAGVRRMLERALTELTGFPDAAMAVHRLFSGFDHPAASIAMKVNALSKDTPTHPAVARALAGILADAGAHDLSVYDRDRPELERAGFARRDGDPFTVRASSDDLEGFEGPWLEVGDARVRMSNVAWQAGMLVSLAVLKNHPMTGATLTLKNHFGSIDQPTALHGRANDCCPGIARLAADPAFHSRGRLAVVDALFGTYQAGINAPPEFAPMALVVSRDPVAADAVALSMINGRRARAGLGPVVARHVDEAAALGLGVADLAAIDLREVVLSPAVERPREVPGCGCSSGAAALAAAALAARR